jgi:ribose 5-phosphate isomerase A
MTSDDLKLAAARQAVTFVESGMKLGLGTGSTASRFVDALAERVRLEGLDVVCVPTSEATRQQAAQLGLKLTTLDETPFLDLAVDGADEVDSALRLIKGGGGALLREKIVAAASDRFVVIADVSKRVETLGRFPLPVEVVRFGVTSTFAMIGALCDELGYEPRLQLRPGQGDEPYLTDNGNCIIDCALDRLIDPEALADALHLVPGVVEHGLFIGFTDMAIIAGQTGVEMIEAVAEA